MAEITRKPILTIDALVDIDQLEIGIASGISEEFLVNLIDCIVSEYINQKPCKEQNISLNYIKNKINNLYKLCD